MFLIAAASREIRCFIKVVYTKKKDKHYSVFVANNTASAVVQHLLQPNLCQLLFFAAVIRNSQKKLKVSLNVCVKTGVKVNKDVLARKDKATKEAKEAINIKVNLA
jgi:hypothetical protein